MTECSQYILGLMTTIKELTIHVFKALETATVQRFSTNAIYYTCQ